ncbi:hypothetical protein [Alteraurantiacibacter buctensis]|uniref:Uncharacterized protein n=1 Tax=Alteraurantiacibacter buctensis TaxID=1503981 RepID=A0A844Z243_9SPHN|nr:hypothetical protein [Alteraurantiacibacter buctensis]MXO73592.1 hypothetical protein [Alteraurantiacibacter buctensis]
MTTSAQRFAAVMALATLGAGILGFMVFAVLRDGTVSGEDGGWMAAAFLSLREVFSKIENIVLGSARP